MLTEGSGYRNRRGREISFSKPFDNYRSGSGSKQDSPSIAVESVAELYREKNRTFSPLHNLHYKYLPHNYISPEKKEAKYHQKQNHQNEAINSKIKNLLSSIDQEEKRKEIYNQKYYNKAEYENVSRYSYHNYENTPKRYQNANDSVYKKPSLQKTIQHAQRYTTPLREKNTINEVLRQKQYSVSSIKQPQSYSASYKENVLPPKPTYLKTSTPHKQEMLHSSSYSNINSRYLEYSASRIKRQKQSDQNSSTLQTNKNVDNQIAKLQRKIQQLQQMKVEVCSNNHQSRNNMKSIDQLTVVPAISNVSEKLNLQQSNSSSGIYRSKGQGNPRTLSQEELHRRKQGREEVVQKSSNIYYQKLSCSQHKMENRLDEIASFKSSMFSSMLNTKTPIQLSKHTESILKESETQLIKCLGQSDSNSQLYAQNSKVSNEDIGVPKILQKLATKRKKAQNKAQISNVAIQNPSGSSVSQFFNTNTQTPMSIETRRQYINQIKAKDLNNAVNSLSQFQAKNQISRFLSNIKNQILIDEDLRKVKKWFLRNRNQFKWRDLQVLLRKNHLYFDEKTMRNTFSIASQEENPFYQPKQSQYTLEHLVSHYERAQKHWAENIVKNYNKQKLQKAGFSEQSIDIARKGSISIEDLVRYVNFQLDTYYRNRDIYVIFHRLKKAEELRFIDIIKCLAHY